MIKALGAFLISALISCILAPVVSKISKRLRAEQPILGYVEKHASKQGTPTMGGLTFVLASIISALIFLPIGSQGVIAGLIMLSFAVIGFLDDYIKVHYKKNMGLRPYQKVIAQGAISVIVAIYAVKRLNVGALSLPFKLGALELGVLALPFYVLVTVGTTNAVNLTDGLDGLASVTSVVAYTAFAVLCALDGQTELTTFSVAVVGALAVFLVVNCFPAKIFMGDTGSLALGGGLSALAIFSGKVAYLPLVGLPFVVSALSVIVQVTYFKLTKGKRVFIMAPFHHHLEGLGVHENKITFAYGLVSLIISVLVIMTS